MDSLKRLVLKWLGLYDLIDNLEKLEKEMKIYKAKLEYFASAAAGMAEIVKQNMCVGDAKKMEDAHTMMKYLCSCFNKKEF